MALYSAEHPTKDDRTGIDVTLGFKLPGDTTLSQPAGTVYLQPETEWFLSFSNQTSGRWKLLVEIDGVELPPLVFSGTNDVLDFNPMTKSRFKFVERTKQNDQHFGVSKDTGSVVVKCYKEVPQMTSFSGYDPFGGGVLRGGETTRSVGGRTVGGSQSDRQLNVAERGTYSLTSTVFTFDLKVDPRFTTPTRKPPASVTCRHCQTVNAPWNDSCWRCGGTLA
jgi:hypothetical protein